MVIRKVTAEDNARERAQLLSRPTLQANPIGMSAAQLVESMSQTSFQGRELGKCAKVCANALVDPDVTFFLSVASPMIAGGQRKALREWIDRGYVDVLLSTGGILYQDIYQARGFNHYMGEPVMDDELLADLNIDRIYDTLVDEEKFKETDKLLGEWALDLEERPYGSGELMEYFADRLKELPGSDESVIVTARKKGVRILCPALEDSSIGIGLTRAYAATSGKFTIDGLADNYDLAIVKRASAKTGVFYVGGGVPKNTTEQLAITADVLFDDTFDGHSYVAQITADAPHWGGLSGCTPREAVSWTKNKPDVDYAMSSVDMTIGFPLVTAFVGEKVPIRENKRFNYERPKPIV